MSKPLRTIFLPLLCCTALLASSAQAALQALEDESLSQISGQAGITIRLDLMARIDEIRWQDDGGSLALRNVKIDNGCLKPSDCDGYALGPAQLGASVPILGLEVPTLECGCGQGQQRSEPAATETTESDRDQPATRPTGKTGDPRASGQ